MSAAALAMSEKLEMSKGAANEFVSIKGEALRIVHATTRSRPLFLTMILCMKIVTPPLQMTVSFRRRFRC
jgi:hypothetical protein